MGRIWRGGVIVALAMCVAVGACGGNVRGSADGGYRSCSAWCDAVRAQCGSAQADCESQCTSTLVALPAQCAQAADAFSYCAATDPDLNVTCGNSPQLALPAGHCGQQQAAVAQACDSAVGYSPGPPCTDIAASCDERSTEGACQDWSIPSAGVGQVKQDCKGTWSDSPCDRSGSLGGCRIAGGGICSNLWFYPPGTAGTVKSICPGAYLSP